MKKKPIMSFVFDFIDDVKDATDGGTPFNDELKILRNVVYKNVDGKDLSMDIYFPSTKTCEKYPVVVDIPGGGWMISNRARRDNFGRLMAVMGAIVFIIDHRFCPEVYFPENLHDVTAALNFLKTLENEYCLDLDDVTITGDSSGGHLAACTVCACTDDNYRIKVGVPELLIKPKFLMTMCGAFSFETLYKLPLTHTLIVRYFSGQKTRTDFRNWEFYKECNPYNFINSNFPESLNLGGLTDFMCFGDAKKLTGILNKLGVKNKCIIGKNLYNSGHCYNFRLSFPPARRDMLTLFDWYAKKQNECGYDMSVGFARVEKFLKNYRAALSKKLEC